MRLFRTARRTGGLVAGTAAVLVLGALGGCAADPGPVGPRKMPTALASAPPPAPVVTERAVLATAREAANREDVPAMMAALQTLPVAERGAVVRELATGLAHQDPERAARVAQAMPPGLGQTHAVEAVARERARSDPAGAVAWVLAWPQAATAVAARQAVAEQAVERDARWVVEQVRELPESPARNEFFGFTIAAWARRDPAAAMGWVRDLPAGGQKTRATTSLGFALAHSAPERAIEVAEWLPEGRDRWLVIGAIGQTWVARNPDEAWRWAGQLPAGAAREAAVAGIETGLGGARSRRQSGVVASAGLRVGGAGGGGRPTDLTTQPPGPERDRELRRQFEEALLASPRRAADWLAGLPLPDRKDDMVDDLARQWLRTDPRAARTWMDQTILSPAHREQLLREAGR